MDKAGVFLPWSFVAVDLKVIFEYFVREHESLIEQKKEVECERSFRVDVTVLQ